MNCTEFNNEIDSYINLLKAIENLCMNENCLNDNVYEEILSKINIDKQGIIKTISGSSEIVENFFSALNKKVEKEAELQEQLISLKTKMNNSLGYQAYLNRLLKYRLYKFMDKSNWEQAVIEEGFEFTGKVFDLKNPKTLNEKVSWLKLYDQRPLLTVVADKVRVRDYVEQKLGNSGLLVNLIGVYENPAEIDFDALPDRFVLKANHGSGYNLICKDKSNFDIDMARKKMNEWLFQDFSFVALEPHYSSIPKKIIIEEYMENDGSGIDDYKVFCFNGKPCVIMYITGRYVHKQCAFYDLDWNRLPYINYDFAMLEKDFEKPENLDKVINYAKILSQDFTVARVDFYILNDGSIKFGEITLTPAAGHSRISDNADVEMGAMIKLPNIVPIVYCK